MRLPCTVLLAAVCLLAPARSVPAADQQVASEPVPLEAWLALDPIPLHRPAAPPGAEPESLSSLAESRRLDAPSTVPAEGGRVETAEGLTLRWQAVESEDGSLPALGFPEGADGAVFHLAGYVRTDRFVEARLTHRGSHPARTLVDGTWHEVSADPGVELAFPTGKHPLWLEVVLPAEDSGEGLGEVTLEAEPGDAEVAFTTSPRHSLRLTDLLDVEAASELRLSHDGTRLAIDMAEPPVPAEDRRTWQEIRDAATGRLLRDSGTASWSEMAWAPASNRFAYAVENGETTSLWIDEGGTARKLADGLSGARGLTWAPDGRSLFYAAAVDDREEGNDEELARRVRSLAHRRESVRRNVQLFQVGVSDGGRRQLTAGPRSAELQDVDRDGAALLFSRSVYHEDRRPFESTAIWELDLGSMQARELTTIPFGASAQYAPDGSGVLIQAGPSAFDDVGRKLPSSEIPNDYDQQLYRLDPDTGEAVSLTEDFAPSVAAVHAPAEGTTIYLETIDGPGRVLYGLDLESGRFERLDVGQETIEAASLSADGSRVAWLGSSAGLPPRIGSSPAEPAQWSPRTVSIPAAEREEHLVLGEVEDWDYRTDDGTTLDGRVHLPPGFDPERRYPAIVYYYGGTSPVTREFGGRYPKNLWAAQGYVVYVLQPSGAIGYGQEFSARHVNDWGERVAGEIIAATRAFLDDHPFVDDDRVGCIGASYGGFMTQLLVTKTDLFDAAVSHAGISSISSYWGEGHWGYLYNAVSAAGSYPWNSPGIYIDQSPLFHADAISTPLLLLHGDADPNVPPGESHQMFTALRVLGKTVELVEIPGEPHWILQLDKRRMWSETIVAWFDRELRDRPAYWNHLYPPEDR